MTGQPLLRADIEALIPHKGAMCLWEQVLDWDAGGIRLQSHGHRDPDHPLRSEGMLRALHLCEYGAQAMAVHGGLLARETGGGVARLGMLVALRGVQVHVTRIDDLDGAIACDALLLASSPASQQYGFRISHGDRLLAEGRAAVMLQTMKSSSAALPPVSIADKRVQK